jgi:hypothetical protein
MRERQAEASLITGRGRSFVVGVIVGRRQASWPLARLDVSKAALQVRCWPFSWYFKPRTIAWYNVEAILGTGAPGGPILKIKDRTMEFDNITIRLGLAYRRIEEELRNCGYPPIEEM